MWAISFITREQLIEHVKLTIKKYGEKLEPFDLEKFNSNIIDPIKLIFDKTVYDSTWDEIVKSEIFRQRDKSNNNDIGYFHQKIFRYMADCTVPETGWDVIFTKKDGVALPDGEMVKTVFVEMKNKHNTMNSASAGKTYIKMQSELLANDDCACFLVEAIAKRSQNIKWKTTVDKKTVQHKLIRRVSMDKFYELVTGQADAFYKLCAVLPEIIQQVVDEVNEIKVPHDTVIAELKTIAETKNISFAMALYLLGFGEYEGFEGKTISA